MDLKITVTSGGCGMSSALIEPHPSYYSAYNHSIANSREEQYHDIEALPPVGRAVWQLMLAMVAKGLLTVFTFGLKVLTLCTSLFLAENNYSDIFVGTYLLIV